MEGTGEEERQGRRGHPTSDGADELEAGVGGGGAGLAAPVQPKPRELGLREVSAECEARPHRESEHCRSKYLTWGQST